MNCQIKNCTSHSIFQMVEDPILHSDSVYQQYVGVILPKKRKKKSKSQKEQHILSYLIVIIF